MLLPLRSREDRELDEAFNFLSVWLLNQREKLSDAQREKRDRLDQILSMDWRRDKPGKGCVRSQTSLSLLGLLVTCAQGHIVQSRP
jgi:hypothetical protein